MKKKASAINWKPAAAVFTVLAVIGGVWGTWPVAESGYVLGESSDCDCKGGKSEPSRQFVASFREDKLECADLNRLNTVDSLAKAGRERIRSKNVEANGNVSDDGRLELEAYEKSIALFKNSKDVVGARRITCETTSRAKKVARDVCKDYCKNANEATKKNVKKQNGANDTEKKYMLKKEDRMEKMQKTIENNVTKKSSVGERFRSIFRRD